ncbi:enoyl-CoA hydratase/isomerase family protein [Pelomonas sp. SE-A7]|uniref:enoyl-CoA hydratase/isomerase family protein n=1 Tax=Pelomonas sp. SE-A7 TaxID=3054953 RepID=UPI00259CB790|nr:enoyl-CoA hydratase/isomerase family protein [Pelomonas sp. SE-A7]MDM4764770.1 enoyl-CoA hydratase/isomerase family protein [Pelomonas sp. SE-A7]
MNKPIDGKADMTTQDSVLRVERLGAVTRLVLARPKAMNAINLALLDALDRALDEAGNDAANRVLLLTGEGPAFCAGADLKALLAGRDAAPGEPDFLDRAGAVLTRLREFPRPVIAALNGVTMAGGLELALCADIVVAADTASLADAHANYGVFPGAGGAALLPRVLPPQLAMYLLFTGKALSAAQMQAHGLVSEIHPAVELSEAALALARGIADKSPAALARMKQVARHSMDKSAADALLHEQVLLRQHLRSADLQEGLAAFIEKRAPVFTGR